jgi:small redox-active disulfide protein 2
MENKNIKIQVLGSGCPTCEKLYKLTKQATEELGLKIDVEYITDIQKIVEMGVMTSPVLAINQKPILAGFLPSLEKIKEIIKKYI